MGLARARHFNVKANPGALIAGGSEMLLKGDASLGAHVKQCVCGYFLLLLLALSLIFVLSQSFSRVGYVCVPWLLLLYFVACV